MFPETRLQAQQKTAGSNPAPPPRRFAVCVITLLIKLTAGKDRPPGLAIPAVIWGSSSAAEHLRPESVRWFRCRRASAVRIRPAPPMPKPGLALRLGFTLPRGLHRDRAISSTFFLTAGKDRPVAGGIPLPEFGPLDASYSETAKPDGNTDAGQPIVFGT